ncbi:hypothetical protein BDGGKGIB_00581 [Nodularia sphaerocarpa UHCC 0038]|nr:hypothetical protein BDGGKGIB_00581 [Nodularia sphaerocarpa UHCC 0038]
MTALLAIIYTRFIEKSYTSVYSNNAKINVL